MSCPRVRLDELPRWYSSRKGNCWDRIWLELGRRVRRGDDVSRVCRRRLRGSGDWRGRSRPGWCLGEKVSCSVPPTPSVADVFLISQIIVAQSSRRPPMPGRLTKRRLKGNSWGDGGAWLWGMNQSLDARSGVWRRTKRRE